MQLHLVQLDITWEDPPANHARVRDLLAGQPLAPGGLIILPEMFATGFGVAPDRVADEPELLTERFIRDLAAETACVVLAGLVRRAPDGRGLNQAVAIGPDGTELARYTKLHPFSFAGEDRHFAPGSELVTFSRAGATIAPFICYDLRFPEAFRHAARRGANVMIVIANFPAPRHEHWTALLRARAIENQAWVVGVNRTGDDPGNHYRGGSLVVDPLGGVVLEAGQPEAVFSVTIDPAQAVAQRATFPVLDDLRDELLGHVAR